MRMLRAETNIDKLKLCYIQPASFFESLLSSFNNTDNGIIDYMEFRLHLDDTECNQDNQIVKMIVSVQYDMDGNNNCLGEFEFSLTGKYKGLCFFTFNNEALYTLFQHYEGIKYNVISFIEFVTAVLGLEFNNVTLAEICLDTNKNLIAALRKYIMDYKGYEMFLNGNLVHDEYRKLENYGEYFSRSRKKLSRQPTLYLHQKKQSGLALRVYNKSAELEGSQKDYITNWLGFGGQTIYRAEITIRNTEIRQYCDDTNHEYNEVIQLLIDKDWRDGVWADAVRRIIYFRSRTTGEEVELGDILKSI